LIERRGHQVRFIIPKVLAISQLSGASFPLDITLRVVEQQDNTAGRGEA